MKREYPMGSVSSGTMRPEDLIPDFVWELRHLTYGKARTHDLALCRDIEKRMKSDDYYDSEDSSYDLDELFDRLNTYAAPYFYFGAHPGDGADYGFWLSEDFEYDFDGLKVNDLSDVPKGYTGEVLVVNDHGNMTLYQKPNRGRMVEIWALV